jgi:hypothetical protein
MDPATGLRIAKNPAITVMIPRMISKLLFFI